MIKAVGEGTKGKVLILGLSQLNIDKLKAGLPIHFRLDELGIPGWSVAMLFGDTEEQIVADLKKIGMNVEAEVRVEDKRTKPL